MTLNDAGDDRLEPAMPLAQHFTVLTNSIGETLFNWVGQASTADMANLYAKRSYLAASKAMCLAHGPFSLVLEGDLAISAGRSVALPASTGLGITIRALERRLAVHAGSHPVFDFATADCLVHDAALSDQACLQAMARRNAIAIVLPYFIRQDVIRINPARVRVGENDFIALSECALTNSLMYLTSTCLMACSAITGSFTLGNGNFQFPISSGSASARAAALVYGPQPATLLKGWFERLNNN